MSPRITTKQPADVNTRASSQKPPRKRFEKQNRELTPMDANKTGAFLLAESLCGMNSALRLEWSAGFIPPCRLSLDLRHSIDYAHTLRPS